MAARHRQELEQKQPRCSPANRLECGFSPGKAARSIDQRGCTPADFALYLLLSNLRSVPARSAVPPAWVDQCAWWWIRLARWRRAPWTAFRRELLAALSERASPTCELADYGPVLWGSIYALRLRRVRGARLRVEIR
jgi:hypothetical protein